MKDSRRDFSIIEGPTLSESKDILYSALEFPLT